MGGAAILVRGVGKRLRRYREPGPQTFQEALVRGLFQRGWRGDDSFWALRDVSFTLEQGQSLGVIGRNGAGKSTLLRLLGGIGRPDEGEVTVRGRIGALLDLGAGFHPDLSGRENLYINGTVSGLTRREIAARFDAIVAFAELEAFIDSPLRTYSSGMQMRLAFAVAVHTDPEILMIDEVLAVGDIAFQQKCFRRIEEFKKVGCTIVLVSHEAELVEQFCDTCLWLRSGVVESLGPSREVVERYTTNAHREMETVYRNESVPEIGNTVVPAVNPPGAVGALVWNVNHFGSQEMQITAIRLRDLQGQTIQELTSGMGLCVEIDWYSPQPVSHPIFGVALTRSDGLICCDVSTEGGQIELPVLVGSGTVRLYLERLDLVGGSYFVDVGIHKAGWAYSYDDHRGIYPLCILPPSEGNDGVLCVPHRWENHSSAEGSDEELQGTVEGWLNKHSTR
jgi:lipopolysaccharide transport system ATP-binding protein